MDLASTKKKEKKNEMPPLQCPTHTKRKKGKKERKRKPVTRSKECSSKKEFKHLLNINKISLVENFVFSLVIISFHSHPRELLAIEEDHVSSPYPQSNPNNKLDFCPMKWTVTCLVRTILHL